MSKEPQTAHPRAIMGTNILGTLGYLSVLLQWTWTLLILCYPLLIADHSFLVPSKPIHPVYVSTSAAASSPIGIIIALVATAFILVLTAVLLVRLPRKIGLRGARLTHQTANLVIPLMAKHKSLPKKRRLKLSYQIVLVVKIVLIILPLVGLIYIPAATPLSGLVIWSLGIFCASWSLCFFGLQQLTGLIFKVPFDRLW